MINLKMALTCPLFQGINENDLIAVSRCLKIRIKTFSKNEFILTENSPFFDVLVVLKGKAVETTFSKDNSNLLRLVATNEIFGLEQAVLNEQNINLNLEAKTSCTVMLINAKSLITPCVNMCQRHMIIKENLAKILANKNRELINKMALLGKRTIKEKVLYYLISQQQLTNSNYFDIPFSRQQLADYLNIDRSALSFVLSKLKQQKIIDYSKNHFHIKSNIKI